VTRLITGVALALASLSSTGCGGLFPKPSPSRLFALTSLPLTGSDTNHSGEISLGIAPIQLPGYLDRQEIVTRVAANRLDIGARDRWAEPLDENFTRVLTQDLSILLRTDKVVAFPWPIDKGPHYRVNIQVLRFESTSAPEAELSARWAIVDETGKKAPNQSESHLVRLATEQSVDASVAALSETVADLSLEIAKAVVALDGQREP
jgi:uncharacterized protein